MPSFNTSSAQSRSDHWQSIIRQQANSGLTQKAFCHQQSIQLSTFTYWKHRLKNKALSEAHEEPGDKQEHPLWIEVTNGRTLADSPPAWQIELELPGGVILRIR